MGGNDWRNRVERDEKSKGARLFQGAGRNAKILGNHWGAIGIDAELEFQRIVVEPYWQYRYTDEDGKKVGGRDGPINDEEMFHLFDTYIAERSWICGDSLSTQCSYLASNPEKQHKL